LALHEALWGVAWAGPVWRQPWRRFRTHLSVGQVKGRPALLRRLDELRRGRQPVQFAGDRVSLIGRGDPPDDVFRVAREVPLGGAS
jgi:hypothetical protein